MAWRTWGRCLSRCEIYAGSMIIKGGTLLLASSRFTEMRAEWKRLLRPLDRPVLYETSFRNRWKIWKKSQWSIILSSVAIMQLRVCARMHPFLYTKRRNKRRILLRSKFKEKRRHFQSNQCINQTPHCCADAVASGRKKRKPTQCSKKCSLNIEKSLQYAVCNIHPKNENEEWKMRRRERKELNLW